jgi:adenylylsulfate kinase-like enzyme
MHSSKNVSVLIVTGPTGVGKSVVADEVFEILRGQNVAITLINLDELGYSHPAPKNDPYHKSLRMKNLAAVWKNYREAGAQRVVIPWVVVRQEEVEQFRQAIPGADIYIVRLSAPLETIKERIYNRPMGGDAAWHTRRAAELIEVFATHSIGGAVIDTENKTIAAVAEEVVDSWLGRVRHGA